MLTNDVVSFEQLNPGSYCCHPDISIGIGLAVTLKIFVTKFYIVIGKGQSGELSYIWTGLV